MCIYVDKMSHYVYNYGISTHQCVSDDFETSMKRINVTVRADQYELMSNQGLNASGLIRGLLDDHFSETTIVFSVSAEVKEIYQQVISNFGGDDSELETFFVDAMDRYLEQKTTQISQLRDSIVPGKTEVTK